MSPLRLSDFDYPLPPERIAQRPAPERDGARLLVCAPDGLRDRWVRQLGEELRAGDILVLNDTRVIPARLLGHKESGGRAEVLLLRPLDVAGEWLALVGTHKRVTPGLGVRVAEDLTVRVLARVEAEGGFRVRLECDGDPMAALRQRGRLPLPPYITGSDPEEDLDRYQTVFACHDGAVAAPTAGLHFTPELLEALARQGIAQARVTLHVGPGTFQPVRHEDLSQHPMHREWCRVTPEAAARINAARVAGGRVVAVGTTAVRTLETAADPHGVVHPLAGETDLFILPGYRFKAVDRMLTNFHLPRSTLLMLVAAFMGKTAMERAYAHAIHHGYRFYSYGDAMLLTPSAETP